ncbi:MAG: ribonucleoside hydrolase RihC [Arcanobacterium sp.]|nr:ribonucleoside hydrolase RihC [Arcanobacterium sp.]
MTIPLIIDTDPGIDDAVAIAMAIADPRLDIRLITTTAGNVGIGKTTTNALKLLEFWESHIPVAKGATLPLLRQPRDAANIHGDSGMDGYDFPEPRGSNLLNIPAAQAIKETLEQSEEKVTIIELAPMTNLALFIRTYPQYLSKIERIIFMGGSTQRGNLGVLSEFNIGVDPEAAHIVIHSGIPIHMVPLDIGWKALVYPDDSQRIKSLNRTGEMLFGLLSHYRSKGLREGLHMYDGSAIAYLLKPSIFETSRVPIEIEIDGRHTSGATLVDFKGYLDSSATVVATVALDVDPEAFTRLLLQQLALCS